MSETTEVKGQFGLGQSGGTGKKLKIYFYYRMSYSKQQPSLYTTDRAKNNQLLNCIFGNHDLACGCQDPASHLTHLLIHNCKPTKFNKEETKEIQKWCGELTEDGDQEDTTGLEPGELDALFAEDDTGTDG